MLSDCVKFRAIKPLFALDAILPMTSHGVPLPFASQATPNAIDFDLSAKGVRTHIKVLLTSPRLVCPPH